MVVPKTYRKYTSRKVLTTQWIEGEKLSQSTESDVGELVNVGVICYLKQVLKCISDLLVIFIYLLIEIISHFFGMAIMYVSCDINVGYFLLFLVMFVSVLVPL